MAIAQLVIAFSFGIAFLVVLIVLAGYFPTPTAFQRQVFRVVLSLAAAMIAAMIPGFLEVQLDASGLVIRAGGALVTFVSVYFLNPARDPDSVSLSTREKAVAHRHLDLINGRIVGKDPRYLPWALSFGHPQLVAFYNKLSS